MGKSCADPLSRRNEMKNSTKMVLVALAAIVLVSTVAILTPRATHVLAAGPTTITYNMPRKPWTSYCAPPAAPPNIYYTSCTITAPSGGELVIQMISGYQIAPVPTRLQAQVSTQVAPAIGPTINWFTMLSPVDIQGSDYYYWSYPVTLYADPGTTITVTLVNQNGHPLTTLNARVAMTGYYVTPPPS
jgi:archaellin